MRRIAAFVATLTVSVIVMTGCAGDSDAPQAGGGEPTPTPAPATTAVDAASATPARQPHSLVLTAEGTGAIDSFTYVLDGKTTRGRKARMPWRQSLDIPADGKRHEWSLTVDFRNGGVDLVAFFNGQEFTRSSGSTSGGTGHVSISGSVQG
jgi:hypothetical protein